MPTTSSTHTLLDAARKLTELLEEMPTPPGRQALHHSQSTSLQQLAHIFQHTVLRAAGPINQLINQTCIP